MQRWWERWLEGCAVLAVLLRGNRRFMMGDLVRGEDWKF